MIAVISNPALVTAAGFHLLAATWLASAVLLCSRPQLWLPLLGLFLGWLTAFTDHLSHEPQLPALLLLASSFFLAFARPRHAWRWALLIGVWIPAGGLIGLTLKVAERPPSHSLAWLVPLILALVGAYGGAFAAQVAAGGRPPARPVGICLNPEEP